MTTLKQAIKDNRLNDFIKARSKEDKKGDKEKFDRIIKSISKLPQKLRKHRLRTIARI